MALPGLRSTNDMGTDGRPMNWRAGLSLLSPREHKAPLFALTSKMAKESTDDPQFHWWEEEVDMLTLTVNGAVASTSTTTVTIDQYGTRLKVGDIFLNQNTNEHLRVQSVTSDTVIEFTRGFAGSTAVNIGNDNVLVYIGSAFREGAPVATGTSFNPTKYYNYTPIFRDPIEWTRTATKTRLRYTTDIMKEDRRRAAHKHAMGIERALWLGRRWESTEAGQPIRTTGGLISHIHANNIQAVQGGGGALDADELFSYFPRMFEYGSSEKLAFASIGVLTIIGELVRKNGNMQIGPMEKEFGMDVRRVTHAAGTLVLTEHPLMGRSSGFLPDSLVVLDTNGWKFRYITDTTLLKDRQAAGTDGMAEEYLTECGCEFPHGKKHFQLTGILSAGTDA